MLFIHVETGESVEKAIKRFKKKFEKTGVLKNYAEGAISKKDPLHAVMRFFEHLTDNQSKQKK